MGAAAPVPNGTLLEAICETEVGVYETTMCRAWPGIWAWDWKNWGHRWKAEGSWCHCSRIVSYRVRRYPAASALIASCANVKGEDA